MSRVELVKHARALCQKLREIESNESYKSVWGMARAHGIQYDGPSYSPELKILEAAVSEIESQRPDPERLMALRKAIDAATKVGNIKADGWGKLAEDFDDLMVGQNTLAAMLVRFTSMSPNKAFMAACGLDRAARRVCRGVYKPKRQNSK